MNEQNEQPKKKIINISKIDGIKQNQEGLDVIIGFSIYENKDGKDIKYTLWQLKQDKTQTKAYQQFKSQGLMIGSSVGIAYKEKPNNFQFKDRVTGEMKEAKSTNRTIAWFSEPSQIEEYDERKGVDESKIGSPASEWSPKKAPVKDLGLNDIDDEEIRVENIPF